VAVGRCKEHAAGTPGSVTTANVIGVVDGCPVAVWVPVAAGVYDPTPMTAFVGALDVKVTDWVAGAIVIVNAADACRPGASVAVTVTVKEPLVPLVVGRPERCPFADRTRPAGRPVAVHVYGVVPPDAVRSVAV
jgi:hypothetical protein